MPVIIPKSENPESSDTKLKWVESFDLAIIIFSIASTIFLVKKIEEYLVMINIMAKYDIGRSRRYDIYLPDGIFYWGGFFPSLIFHIFLMLSLFIGVFYCSRKIRHFFIFKRYPELKKQNNHNL